MEIQNPKLGNSSPVVANGIVYISSGDGSFYALNASDGRFRLKFNTYTGGIQSSPAVNNREVYFTVSGALYALNGQGRTWPWEDFIRPLWLQLWVIGLAPGHHQYQALRKRSDY